MTGEALLLAGALAGLVVAKLVLIAADYAPALARRRGMRPAVGMTRT